MKSGMIKISEDDEYITQIHLQVDFDQNKPFEEQLGVLEFIPYIKKIKGEEFKLVGVLEETCSFHGIYELRIYPDHTELTVTSCGHLKIVFSNVDIKVVLKHVYDNFPYKRKK